MPTGGLASGMSQLADWLADSPTTDFDSALQDLVRQSGWSCAGIIWPWVDQPKVALSATAGRVDALAHLPAELDEVTKSLLAGHKTVIWQVPGTSGRLYAMLTPPGLPAGVFWAERSSRDPWTETDRSFVCLVAAVLERSSILSRKIGPIIEANRLEQRLKDASVIAGRMAHDFDNILTGIMGFADLTHPMLTPGSQPAKFVAEINKVGARGITFTQQLHQLSRSAQTKPQPGLIPTAFAKEESRVRPSFPLGLSLTTQLPQTLPSVAMEAGPLGTVLGHLLENASEASSANGRIIVNARTVELNWNDARGFLGLVSAGPHAEVTIQDFGSGIKPEVRAKLFVEPFFTTKVRHRGLGLAIVYRVLFAHRGGIRIDAATPPDPGTVVRVVIPLASARPAAAPTAILGTPAPGV